MFNASVFLLCLSDKLPCYAEAIHRGSTGSPELVEEIITTVMVFFMIQYSEESVKVIYEELHTMCIVEQKLMRQHCKGEEIHPSPLQGASFQCDTLL
ncbi:MAG TPA: hypothetical protein DHW02_00805 [Ktedonobacter sp.]|nr:hypothetical protein [Ktedonobacter sp.]